MGGRLNRLVELMGFEEGFQTVENSPGYLLLENFRFDAFFVRKVRDRTG
jgi:hypothetical protein